MLRTAIGLLALAATTLSSPFLLTDNYIKEFKQGIAQLQKNALEHTFEETNYDFDLHNETEAELDPIEYDFIIVGAGAAGSVIANRLSEKPEWKVLVLEAGGPETPYTKIPRFASLLQNTDFNWGFKTVPQKTWCQGMINNQCLIAGGKALGGSTSINGMLYTRGNPHDYDAWADLGNDGWCYDDVLPYFKKAEDANLAHFDHKYHNRGGPFHVEHPQYKTHITNDSLAAAQELGLNIVDYNGKQQLGVGLAQLSTKHGKRQSTAQAYLEPASKRPNLVIKPFSHVTKLLIAPHTKAAESVLYLHEGKLHEAKATKEIILSAGIFNTVQLLMLSGIGPKEQLEKLDIPLVENLNVGRKFKDHVGFIGLDFIFNDTNADETAKEGNDYDEVVDYLKNGKGRLSTNGFETVGYIQIEESKHNTKYPDLEIFFMGKTLSSDHEVNPLGFKEETFTSLWGPVKNKKAINVGLLLAHPKSTGSVTLKDKDPLHRPLIDPNQLSDPDNHDIKTLISGIKYVLKIMDTNAMKKFNLVLNEHPVAGCEGYKWGSDDYWECAIRHLCISLRHQTGSARMGPKTDKDAVVDNKLRVYGVQKLRVADCSVIPVTITGHTMAPAIMIGEKASDLIKEVWH